MIVIPYVTTVLANFATEAVILNTNGTTTATITNTDALATFNASLALVSSELSSILSDVAADFGGFGTFDAVNVAKHLLITRISIAKRFPS